MRLALGTRGVCECAIDDGFIANYGPGITRLLPLPSRTGLTPSLPGSGLPIPALGTPESQPGRSFCII